MLAVSAVPALAVVAIPLLIESALSAGDPRLKVARLSAAMGWTLLAMLISALFDWRKLALREPFRRQLALWAVIYAAMALWLLTPKHALEYGVPAGVARLLPASLPLSVLICAVPLLTLAWALDSVYAQAEYVNVQQSPKD